MRILPDVYIVGSGEFSITDIPTARPLYDCHVYIVDGGAELALIDAGYGSGSVEQVATYAREWGLDLSRLRLCFLTHAHHDHTRGAAEWQERFGVEICSSQAVADALESIDVRTLAYSCPEGTFPICAVDRILADGEQVPVGDAVIDVVSVPGHTDGDLAFVTCLNELRVAFTGDVFTFDGVETVGFAYPYDVNRDAAKQAAALWRLYKIRPDVVLPGHGMLALRRGWRWLGTALHAAQKDGAQFA